MCKIRQGRAQLECVAGVEGGRKRMPRKTAWAGQITAMQHCQGQALSQAT